MGRISHFIDGGSCCIPSAPATKDFFCGFHGWFNRVSSVKFTRCILTGSGLASSGVLSVDKNWPENVLQKNIYGRDVFA